MDLLLLLSDNKENIYLIELRDKQFNNENTEFNDIYIGKLYHKRIIKKEKETKN